MTPTEAQTKKRLEAEGWKVYHSGFPDFFCFKDGQVMFVEVKKGGQQLTAEQERVMAEIKAVGLLGKVTTLGVESSSFTSIGIRQSTKEKYAAHFKPRENWDDLLLRILDAAEGKKRLEAPAR